MDVNAATRHEVFERGGIRSRQVQLHGAPGAPRWSGKFGLPPFRKGHILDGAQKTLAENLIGLPPFAMWPRMAAAQKAFARDLLCRHEFPKQRGMDWASGGKQATADPLRRRSGQAFDSRPPN